MAFTHGSKATFWLDNTAGSLVDLTAYLDSVSLDRIRDMAETSVLGITNKTYIPGLIDGTIPIGGPWDPTLDSHMNAISDDDVSSTFNFFPAGEPIGVTKPKFAGECWVTNYSIDTSIDDAAKWTGEMQITGAVTRTTA